MRKFIKIFSIIFVLLVAVIVSGVAVLKSIDYSQYKNVIVKEVEKITGRKLTINGELKLELGLDTILSVNNVRFANAPWGSRSDMLKLDQLNIDIKIIPLIQGEIQVERLILIGLDVILETNQQGKGNWEIAGSQEKKDGKAASTSSSIPIIQEIDVKNLKFSYRNGISGETTKAFIDELTLSGEDNTSPLSFALSARLNDMKYHAAGSMGSIDTLLNGNKPFDVNIQGNAAGVLVTVKGKINEPRLAKGIDIKATVSGKELESSIQDFKSIVPALSTIKLPAIGAFRMTANIKGSADQLNISQLDALIGKENDLYLKINGSIANLNDISGLKIRAATAGDELANTVRALKPFVPALKEIKMPKIGPYTLAATVNGSLSALSISGIRVKIGRPSAVLLSAKGRLDSALEGKGVDVNISVEGQSLSSIEKLTGTDLPKIPPFNVVARITDKAGYNIRNLKAKVGVSDVSGQISIKNISSKPVLNVSLESDRLDLDELLPDEPSPQLPEKRTSNTKKPEKIFSREPIDRSALKAVDAKISFKIGRLKIQGNLIEKLEGRASLISGKLNVDHLFATLDEGKLVSKLSFDASHKHPSLKAKADIREFQLGQFLKKAEITDTLKLTIDAELDVSGQGASLHHIMANLQGKTKVVGRNGRINSKFLSGAMSGMSDIVPWFKNEDANKIHCFVSRFDIKEGVAKSKAMLLETAGMTVKGHGVVNLGQETMDITFVPKAKKTSLASFALPMQFKGPLVDPKLSTNVSKEAIATVTNVVSTVGSVLLGPVGILGSIGLGLAENKKSASKDPCVLAMGAYSKPAPAQKAAPVPPAPSAPDTQKQKKSGVTEDVKRNVGNVIEGAGEAVKGVGNALKGLFGSGNK